MGIHRGRDYTRRTRRGGIDCGQHRSNDRRDRGYYYLALGWEMAIRRDPGFRLADVDAGGVDLWVETGELDNVHTPAMSEHLRRHVRRCQVHTVQGQGRLGCTGAPLEAGLARFLGDAPT